MRYMCVLGILVISVAYVLCEEKYTTKYDNIDLDQILSNDRLLQNYVYCALDKGPCTKDAQVLKDHIVEALETNCSKCSEKQRTGINKAIKYLSNNKQDLWKELTAKYDADGAFREKYKDVLEKEGIKA